MELTIVSNKNGLMTKTFDKKLEKSSISQLGEGSYKVIKINSLEQIGVIKKKLKSNQAIILGAPIDNSKEGKIYSRANYKGSGITRTKDMFENKSGLMLFDFDLREYGEITLEEYRKMLIKCDPQLEKCEMFMTYGSSAGIKSKKYGKTGYGSIHAYCVIDKEMYIKSYAAAIFNNGLNLNYGEIKVNEKVFKSYINGIIDLAVLKGDASRIIYEATPILHKKLTRTTKDDLYYKGDKINGSTVNKTHINTTYASKAKDVIHNLKKMYKATSKDKKEVKKRNLERTNEIYGSEKLTLNNGSTIKAREILISNYIEESMRDPYEPEKGPDKAKVFEQLDHTRRPSMHSFLHGGQMYYFHCDLDSIPFLVENLDEDEVIVIVKRDFHGYMLDKAINVLVETMDKTRGVIKKYLKEADTSKNKDIQCSDEGFEEDENMDTDKERALKNLDTTFFILEGAKSLYAEIKDDSEIRYYSTEKMRERYKPFDTKESSFFDNWSRSELRKEIEGFRFDPKQDPFTVNNRGYFNLWKSFDCDPIEGDIEPFVDFTKNIICSGNDEHYEFLMDYLAHMVQYPWKKEGIACVLKGKKGVGKDTWIDAFASLFDKSHYLTANNISVISGTYNIHLQHILLCNIGEAFFSGDHAAEGALKTLVTEKNMNYHEKFKTPFHGENYTRVFMSTNLDWVVPASGSDERRWFVLDVSDCRRGDLEYMSKFRIWLNSGGREALLNYLMEREITHSMYYAPETEALTDQKINTLRGVDQWVYDCASTNELLGADFETNFFNSEVSVNEISNAYKAYTKDKYITYPKIAHRFNELCSPVDMGRKMVNGKKKTLKTIKKDKFIESFVLITGIRLTKSNLGSS